MVKIQLNLEQLKAEHGDLLDFLSRPDAFNDPAYTKKIKRSNELANVISLVERQQDVSKQLAEAVELSRGDDELAELAKEEVPALETEYAQIDDKLFELLTPKDPNDEKDVIVEIRAGAGGDEASLFGAELYRMYARLAERRGFKTELISESPSEVGGYKEIIFGVKGDDVYATL
jgi:peptide chain release factor 1